MHKDKKLQWKFRPLLTETLPYEVPVIFFNDRFYYALSREEDDEEVTKAFQKIFAPVGKYTIPYNYSIRKDQKRTTELSIIHPMWQTRICDMYAMHEGSLLSYCAKSEFSLRRPISIASVYASNALAKDDTSSKLGLVHTVPEDELDPSHIISYFVYGKYNLLSKFYESKEFLRLEKKFSLLRTLDISKCFYNIYTHSISWAIKGKSFAKEYSNAFSFEGSIDKTMQWANYNETNGIVVGPEFSRIFAEIILQEIDVVTQRRLAEKGLREGVQYSIRRYVDDYSIFSDSETNLNDIEQAIAETLREYKLYLNTKKSQTIPRPFISTLSLARIELSEMLAQLRRISDEDSTVASIAIGKLNSGVREVRSILKRYDVDVGYLSGWILSALIKSANRTCRRVKESPVAKEFDHWLKVMRPILDLAFYLCALDVRVRTSYSLCQIIKAVFDAKSVLPSGHFDQIQHLIAEELGGLVKSLLTSKAEEKGDSIELFNLLICGTHFLKEEFTDSNQVRQSVTALLGSSFTYFKYITLKFVFLSDPVFGPQLNQLNAEAFKFLDSGPSHTQCSQRFLVLCDLISAPDLELKDKRLIYGKFFGGVISNKALEAVAQKIGFVDWTALNVEHILRRKELRPVYAMA